MRAGNGKHFTIRHLYHISYFFVKENLLIMRESCVNGKNTEAHTE